MPSLVAGIAENEPRTGHSRARTKRTVTSPRRRFHWTTIGYWLGGIAFATAGGILGVCMPYHHPVAIAMSAIWWGIYVGVFGASVGGLLGLLLDRDPSSGRTAPPYHPPTEERGYDIKVMPTKDSKTVKDVYLLMRSHNNK
jgi:hypothetical protein